MATDDKSGAQDGQQQGQQQQANDDQHSDLAEKFYTKEQVEEIVGKRVTKLGKTNAELLARLEALEKVQKPAKDGDKDPLKELQAEVKRLKAETAQAKADKERAELDKIKIKLAKKAGLPGWFDPALLPGKDPDEVEAAILEIQEQMTEAEGEEAEREEAEKATRLKRGFGTKTPKGKETKLTGNAYMNQLMLAKTGRRVPR